VIKIFKRPGQITTKISFFTILLI